MRTERFIDERTGYAIRPPKLKKVGTPPTTPLGKSARKMVCAVADRHDSWLSWWGDLLNKSNGSVDSILALFDLAGLPTDDLQLTFDEARKENSNA